jgi:hypothetical protein
MLGVAKAALGVERLAPEAARSALDRRKLFLGAMRRVLIALKNKAWQARLALRKIVHLQDPQSLNLPSKPTVLARFSHSFPFLTPESNPTNPNQKKYL